ncbi:hypothetical protein V6N12_031686 [Hibiscus sabdariffa]|uniref:Uncharacterized protein n=1 Tax=Hibiscus sabdariffa TaxID=183260 RepID=A0ABR2DYK5_9ROSI
MIGLWAYSNNSPSVLRLFGTTSRCSKLTKLGCTRRMISRLGHFFFRTYENMSCVECFAKDRMAFALFPTEVWGYRELYPEWGRLENLLIYITDTVCDIL